MKIIKVILMVVIMPIFMATTLHKYYVSVTEIEYIKEKKSIQIITRLFVDDLEVVLRKRYDDDLTLKKTNESKEVNMYLRRYLRDKFKIKINGTMVEYEFIGKEYENDIVYCYMEVKNVNQIKTIEIQNTVLFDMFEDQQNIVKTNINSQNKSFILIPQNDKGLLNFN